MAVATDTRGLKRICMSCGTRFYDMNNRPVICPNCKAEFSAEPKVKGRRGRAASANDEEGQVTKKTAVGAEEADSAEDEDEIIADEDVISLDDVEESDDDDDDDEDLGDLDIDDLDVIEEDDIDDIDDLEEDEDLGKD